MAGMRIGGLDSVMPGVTAHVVTGVRVGLRILSRRHVMTRMGISRSGAVSSVTAHVVTGVRIGLRFLSRSHVVACWGGGRGGRRRDLA